MFLLTSLCIHAVLMIKGRVCIYTHFHAWKSAYMWESLFFGSMVFGPWYCVRSIEPRYWVPSIGSLWFWTMVWVRPKTIKRRRSFGKGWTQVFEYLMKSKIWNTGDWFMVHSWIWIKEEPEHKKMDKFYWWVKTQDLNSSIFCVILICYIWRMTWSINLII